ncbi:2Fe-2S iron-sulfur cluster-binding protein [Lacimicrobium alkaliphilum]|uniref:Ferredoxin n=1 Tax=Lacimicrobium alkaliphilum TaxID=1526571 RepID=A0ABQ1R9P9_9ALTE|nr:2Fe-2S iron-sulfur cluster-binding protein [Lacimicrobium alkaliphilum]GGD61248.1 putative ferredoxin [Lacimicrobium alkaliphilum]
MTTIRFIRPDGKAVTVQAEPGVSLMVAAQENNLPGMAAICGGCCSCGTCHVSLPPESAAKLPTPYAGERQILAQLPSATADSRLACQVVVTDALENISVQLLEP